MLTIKLKMAKKLTLEWAPGQTEVLQRLADYGGTALRKRAQRGVNHDGTPRPELGRNARKGRYFFVHRNDPRLRQLPSGQLRPWAFRGQKGAPEWFAFRGHYREFKIAIGKPQRKGGDFTGAMWASLTASVKRAPGKSGDHILRLYFAGSSPVRGLGKKGKATPQRFRNRDKARLLQFAGRSGVGTHEGAAGREFELMRFSSLEVRDMARMYVTATRLFKPR